MSSRLYSHLMDHSLSSDEDELTRKYAGSTPHPRKLNPLVCYSDRHYPSNDIAEKMKVMSKYDHKVRNVELDGRGFVSHSRKSCGDANRRGKGDARGLSSETVSISEFERNNSYFAGEREIKDGGTQRRGPGGFFLWFCETDWRKQLALACVMGVLFGMLYREYNDGLHLTLSPRDNLLECPSRIDRPCLTSSQLKPALLLIQTLNDYIHTRAGQAECGVESASKSIQISELKTMLPKSSKGDDLRNILFLIHHNPHWNVLWLDSKEGRVTDWSRFPVPTDLLQSTAPSLSYMCTLSKFFGYVWIKIKFIILVVMVILALLGMIRWHIQKKRLLQRSKFLMINKILGIMRRHNEATTRKKSLLPYLAIIHVRDMLITPSERDAKLKIWEEACRWIAKHESRIRTEQQRIAGEDFSCWRWIQVDSPKTKELLPEDVDDVERMTTPISSLLAKNAPPSAARMKNWYEGTTFEDEAGRNTGRNNRINLPYGSPSPCIRLKNMFETKRHLNEEQSKEIEDSVLDRCIPHGGVVHIYVDRRSNFGCVFLKMDRIESAVGAYNGLHGGWYKGKLVTAKYIPIEKYHKWFPTAANAKEHINPST